MCSRIMLMPCVNSSAASTALRPFHGSPAACAVRPSNSTIRLTIAWLDAMSACVSSLGCHASTASTSSNRPSRAM